MAQNLSWEVNWFAASQEIPPFYGTRKFITALTTVRHLSLSWANPIQSTHPHPTSWRSILILTIHLRLGLPSGLFHSDFLIMTLHAPSPHPYAPHGLLISFNTSGLFVSRGRSRLWIFLNLPVLQGWVFSPARNPQAGRQPLFGCSLLLIQFIRGYPPYRRTFLYLQSEKASCRGDRDPLNSLIHHTSSSF